MSAVAEKSRQWLNPDILRWAREWRGKAVEEAAAKIKQTPETIDRWERGVGGPTVRQARVLADFYDRSFLEFFLSEPPTIPMPELVPDFRMHAGVTPPADNRVLQDIQQWAETQRVNALDLLGELGERPTQIPEQLFTTLGANPSEAASRARDGLNFSIHEQINLGNSDASQLPNILRRKLEALGVITLRRTDLKALEVRGMCLAKFPLPVIVFRTEAPSAQAFTLSHEFAHVLIRQSGITGPRKLDYENQPIEKWCDRFAASFLMPAEQVDAIIGKPSAPSSRIDDAELARLAGIFRVSPHAMLIRLVHLGYVRAAYYWEEKKPQFDAEEREYRQFGRSKYYGSRYKASLGDLYTGLVLEAWSSGRITNHNAAEFMGIKNLNHLYDIRDNFVS